MLNKHPAVLLLKYLYFELRHYCHLESAENITKDEKEKQLGHGHIWANACEWPLPAVAIFTSSADQSLWEGGVTVNHLFYSGQSVF